MAATNRTIDLSEMGANIDALLGVYIETQRESGIDVGMKEVDVSIDNDGNISREKSHQDEHTEDKGGCHECSKNCHEKKEEDDDIPWFLVNTMGLFGEENIADDSNDDDDGKYICDWCSDIGYKKEYKPYLCDTCNVCETCTEFNSGDCDGCSYSVYRTGELYSASLAKAGDHSYLEEDEQEIIRSIEEEDYESDVKSPDLTFTIMDYDHKYT